MCVKQVSTVSVQTTQVSSFLHIFIYILEIGPWSHSVILRCSRSSLSTGGGGACNAGCLFLMCNFITTDSMRTNRLFKKNCEQKILKKKKVHFGTLNADMNKKHTHGYKRLFASTDRDSFHFPAGYINMCKAVHLHESDRIPDHG